MRLMDQRRQLLGLLVSMKELSRHAADEAVKQVVSQNMQLDRESNEKLLRQMGALKAGAESQALKPG